MVDIKMDSLQSLSKLHATAAGAKTVAASKPPVAGRAAPGYDDDQDQQIFALGDAALQLDDVNFDDMFRALGVTAPPGNGAVPGASGSELEPVEKKMTVSELEDELTDGSRVRTKIIQGPSYQARASVVTSTRFIDTADASNRLSVPDNGSALRQLSPLDRSDDITWLQRAKDSYIIKRASGEIVLIRAGNVNGFVFSHKECV